MIRLLALLLVIPTWVSAESVSIRAGYKDDYTRLVFSTPEGVDWEVEEDLGFSVVRFSQKIDAVDTSEVFGRIPQKRIKAIKQLDDQTIRVDMRCDCRVRSFQWRPEKFVVDFIGDDEIFDRPQFREGVTDTVAAPEPEKKLPVTKPIPLPDVAQTFERQKDLKELEAALSRSIGIAATQGFLEPVDGDSIDVESVFEQVAEELNDSIGLRSETSVAQRDVLSELEPNQPKDCPSDQELSFLKHKQEEFLTDLSAMRREFALAHSLDHPKLKRKKAEFLLRNGFGLEAAALDREIGKSILSDIGELVDLDRGSRKLSGLVRCQGMAQLFGVLASGSSISITNTDAKSIARSFTELSTPLKSRFRGQLAKSLLSDGHRETARIVFEMKSDYDDIRDKALSSVQADLAIGDGSQDIAIPKAVDAQDLSHSPELVAEILRTSLSEGFQPDQSVIQLAEVMAFELRSEQLGETLKSLLIENEIIHGSLETAKDMLKNSVLSKEAHRTLDTHWMRAVVDHGSVDTFLNAAFSRSPFEYPNDLRLKFAERIKASGFSDASASWHPDTAAPLAEIAAETDEPHPQTSRPETAPNILDQESPIASGHALLSEVTELRERIEKITKLQGEK